MRFTRLAGYRGVGLMGALVIGIATLTFTSASPALAFGVSGAARLTYPFTGVVTVKPGATVTLGSNLSLQITDSASSPAWSAGDSVTFQLWNVTSNVALSRTSSGSTSPASFVSTPVVTASSGLAVPSIALARASTSTVNDEFVLTMPSNAPLDTTTSTFTISSLTLSLGSELASWAGNATIGMRAVASNGTPFVTTNGFVSTGGNSASATVSVGHVAAFTAQVATTAIANPGQQNVAIPAITIATAYSGAIQSGDAVTLALSGGTWVTPPTPSGAPTISGMSGAGTSTLTFTAQGASQFNNSLVLSGAVIDAPSMAGVVVMTVTDGAIIAKPYVAVVIQTARVAGPDRYATGAALFDSAFGTTASVVLTSGANYPDALSAGYLARGLATGILSTDPNVLPAVTAQEIVKHGVQVVYIVGGVGAVSDAVAREVEAIHVGGQASAAQVRVVRIGGSDRYATNDLVDTYSHAQSQTVIIATGEQFADALSVGPAVYVSGYPLVLTPKAGLAASTKSAISALGAKSAIILGGTSAVSANVEAQLKTLGIAAWTRLAGTDRTQTAAQIATWEVMGIAGTSAYPVGLQTLAFNAGDTPAVGTAIYIVRGDTFADALPAGPVAGHKKNIILMTVDPATVGTGGPAFLQNPFELDVVHTVQAIGGTSAISDATLAALVQSAGG